MTKLSREIPMLKRAFVAFMLLLFTAPVLAEPPTPLMWRATGSEGTVYLVGSFHLLRPSDYPLAKSLEQAYQGADRVIFEISPADMQSPDLARKFTAAACCRKGKSSARWCSPRRARSW
nr:TraB/GumN family protein [Alkalisalibacterium limincola]